jgi:hypothetical protein
MRTTPLSLLLEQPDHEQEDSSADDRGHKRADQTARGYAYEAKDGSSDDRSEDADDDVAQDTESTTLYQLAGDPAGNGSNDQEAQKTFSLHARLRITLI